MIRRSTKQQAENRQPPQSDEDRSRKREQKDVKVSGNMVTWKIECTGERKMTGAGSITWRGEESYKGEATFNMRDPRRGPTAMQRSYSGKWLAASCKQEHFSAGPVCSDTPAGANQSCESPCCP